MRLDLFLSQMFSISRNQAECAISSGAVLVNGRVEKKRYIVRKNDAISYKKVAAKKLDLSPVKMAFEVIYDDEHMFVINKPAGLVVHPAPGNYDNTFIHGFLSYCEASSFEDSLRPGLVHRLDKDTSGVLIAAKNQETLSLLSKQFHDRMVCKVYLGICEGRLEKTIEVEESIGRHRTDRKKMSITSSGRSAHTIFTPLVVGAKHTLVKMQPTTGRTHQIRVHAACINHPIVFDQLYGRKSIEYKEKMRQMLHCSEISLTHPWTQRSLQLRASFPEDMIALLQFLKISYNHLFGK